MKDSFSVAPVTIGAPKVIDGISVYERGDYNKWFEAEYINTNEPWDYSNRAAELYRHLCSVNKIRQYNSSPQALLELGCSKGLMTEKLLSFSSNVYAADISLTAVKACRQLTEKKAIESNCQIQYFITTTPGLPFAANTFDVVTVCDGLFGWFLTDSQKRLALKDIYKVLQSGGIAILTDCLMPERNKGEFEMYEAMIRDSPLTVVEISYLYDKPWYLLESFLKKTRLRKNLSMILASIRLAKVLNSIGKLIGRRASRHIVMIVRKD